MTIGEVYTKLIHDYIRMFEKKHGYKFINWLDGCDKIDCQCSDFDIAVFEGDFIFFIADIRLDIDSMVEPLLIYDWARSQEDLKDISKIISFRDYIHL